MLTDRIRYEVMPAGVVNIQAGVCGCRGQSPVQDGQPALSPGYPAEHDVGVADIPDLEACSAFGTSTEEALAEVERARDAWITAALEAGREIPKPRYRPAIYTR